MGKLVGRLGDASRSGVYRAATADAIEEAARGGGVDYARIVLHGVTGKDALLQALAHSLGFPAWFGANWDALEDCLGDLSWRPVGSHVFVLDGWQQLGADELGVLLDVLRASAEFWAGRGKAFFAVFVDPETRLGLPALYRERP